MIRLLRMLIRYALPVVYVGLIVPFALISKRFFDPLGLKSKPKWHHKVERPIDDGSIRRQS